VTPLAAGALVFLTAAAVLIIEILAARLLAPFVGASLETYTAIIGTVLGGISLGTWIGGRLADRLDPRSLLGPLMVGGGSLALATVPVVRIFGAALESSSALSAVTLSLAGIFPPAAVLSAVSPTVVKLQLRDLDVTGRVVGRLSALGTAGAIVGTFLGGFLLVEAVPTSATILAMGATLVLAGVVVWVAGTRHTSGPPRLPRSTTNYLIVGCAVTVGISGLAIAVGDHPCDVETVYHCAEVNPDESRPSGRTLVLDRLNNSYVDLEDPTYLDFRYAKLFAETVDAHAPAGPLDVLHIGGGGFTFPRWFRAVRPGSTSLVLEIDPVLVELSRERLGLVTGPDLEVRHGDARLLLPLLPAQSYDVVLGDAFGGLAVPWHLTTVEFAGMIRDVLRPDGIYVINLIDNAPMRFARAEAATLQAAFGHVVVIAPREFLERQSGGNVVIAASRSPIDAGAIASRIAGRAGIETVLTEEAAAAFADGAPLLTDDYAPVDQWLARTRRNLASGELPGPPPSPVLR
jgi:spermidine synthase